MEGDAVKDNEVRVLGTVKRNASAENVRRGFSMLDFTLEVPTGDERRVYVDCVATSPVVEEHFDGFVDAGETVGVVGHLTFRTYTNGNGRKVSGMVVYVEDVYEIEE